MNLRIPVAAILFVATSGQELNLLHYHNQDEETLKLCIENSENLEEVKNLRGFDFIQAFAKFAAKELVGKYDKNLGFLTGIIKSFRNQFHDLPSTSTDIFWNEDLVEVLKIALLYCSDDYNFKKCSDSYHTINRRFIPTYKFERDQPEIGRYLNLVLCNFPEHLLTMASSPTGFITLMTFADDFVIAIRKAYVSLNHNANNLRIEVRNAWRKRVHNDSCPLSEYYYDAKYGVVYSCGCVKKDKNNLIRKSLDEPVSTEDVLSILQQFQSHTLEGRGDDVYNRYKFHGMLGYEAEFEVFMILKDRATTFFYLLRVIGILSDQTDVIDYNFLGRIPQYLWDILGDDDAYIAYINSLRNFMITFDNLNHLEEEMILFLNGEVNSRGPRLVRHAESLDYHFPHGLYVAYVYVRFNNINNAIFHSYSTTTTTTTTLAPTASRKMTSAVTVGPTTPKSPYKIVKSHAQKLIGRTFGCGNRRSSTAVGHGSSTTNIRASGLCSKSDSENQAICSVKQKSKNCDSLYANLKFKDQTFFLRKALSYYVNCCSQTES